MALSEAERAYRSMCRRDERIRNGRYVWRSETERLNERVCDLRLSGAVTWQNRNPARGFWLHDGSTKTYLGKNGYEADDTLNRWAGLSR